MLKLLTFPFGSAQGDRVKIRKLLVLRYLRLLFTPQGGIAPSGEKGGNERDSLFLSLLHPRHATRVRSL